mmetsp:Transcript_60252/g.72445  ORF Transcript_60252/g.72445 Transcript_60252/m.72445 type:complete len:116 (-) Transcript_60252:296-643(-)
MVYRAVVVVSGSSLGVGTIVFFLGGKKLELDIRKGDAALVIGEGALTIGEVALVIADGGPTKGDGALLGGIMVLGETVRMGERAPARGLTGAEGLKGEFAMGDGARDLMGPLGRL